MKNGFRRGFTLKNALTRLTDKIDKAVDKSLEQAAKDAADFLNQAVKTWKNQPEFIFRPEEGVKYTVQYSIVALGPDRTLAIWGYVDKGTEPHMIFPVKAKALRFRPNYSARTAPIAQADVGTGRSSGAYTYRQGVAHPGNEARDFAAYAALEAEQNIKRYLVYNLRKI